MNVTKSTFENKADEKNEIIEKEEEVTEEKIIEEMNVTKATNEKNESIINQSQDSTIPCTLEKGFSTTFFFTLFHKEEDLYPL